MPKLYEYFGMIFFFYSQEHKPIHIHVKSSDGETVYELVYKGDIFYGINSRNIKGKPSLPKNKEKLAVALIMAKHNDIVKKWNKAFGKDKINFRPEIITRRIK